jgi:hypothetical protein
MAASASITYDWIVEQRRALRIPPYLTLADVGFDGPWVSPYQKTSRSPDGPVLVALHWLDAHSIESNRAILSEMGFLPGIRFNNVLDQALHACGLTRDKIYVTQAFQSIPRTRSEHIPARLIDRSFDAVTRHELIGRRVVALGADAASACKRHGVRCTVTCHPSRRGTSNDGNAGEIAAALAELGF